MYAPENREGQHVVPPGTRIEEVAFGGGVVLEILWVPLQQLGKHPACALQHLLHAMISSQQCSCYKEPPTVLYSIKNSIIIVNYSGYRGELSLLSELWREYRNLSPSVVQGSPSLWRSFHGVSSLEQTEHFLS